MNPGDLDWWWRYGLDGIAAGLLGGAVTAWAVLWSLRHERKAARHDAIVGLCADLAASVTTLAQDLAARKGRAPSAELADRWAADLWRVQTMGFQLYARSERDWPLLSLRIDEARTRLTDVMQPGSEPDILQRRDDIVQALADVGLVCTIWLSDPKMKELKDVVVS